MAKSITIDDKTGTFICTMSEARHCHADAVKYDGKYYRVIGDFDSEYTQGSCSPGHTPVLNLKSGTIRGIDNAEKVEVVELEIVVHPAE